MAEPDREAPAQGHETPRPVVAAESIAGEIQSRIDHAPPLPRDAVDWAAAAAACEREARARGPGLECARLLHQAARIHEERLGNPEVALAQHEAAAEADPTHLPSLQAARRLSAQWNYAARECRFLEAEARATPDSRRSAELDYARARLLAGPMGRPEEARALLAEASARDPGAFVLHAERARLAAVAGDLEDALAAWLRAAESMGDDQAAAQILTGAAALAEERLGRPDEAAALAMRAFRRCPAEGLARALAWRHAERLDRSEDLAEVLAAEGREAAEPRAAALALLQLARLELSRGRPERAQEALAEARVRAPEDPAVLAELVRSAEAREAWAELADALQAQLALPGMPPSEVAATRIRLAEILEQRLERPDEAGQSYRGALAAEPRNRQALAALGRHHAARGEWESVLETFLAERDAADDPRDRAQRCFKAGELLEERLGRPEEAAQQYGQALALDPTLLSAARAQERVLERLGRIGELADVLERELRATSEPAQGLALLFRLARLREDRLGDLAGAADCYRRALGVEPSHVLAHRSLALVLERGGPSHELAEALEAAAGALDGRESVTLFTRAGEVREQLADEARAAADWERALAIDPAHLPALRGLGRLCTRAGRWEELVDMGRAEAEAHPSPESAAALLVRIGEILETRLDRPGEAAAAYREALDLSPAHQGALRSMARLHRARGELEPLVQVLRAEAAARAPAGRAVYLFEAGEIEERGRGDLAAAARLHEEALRADPAFAPSHRSLQRLLTSQARWSELAIACRLEADNASGPARTAALWRFAWVSRERLGDGAAAEAAGRELLRADPAHVGAALLLDRLGANPEPGTRAAVARRLSDPAAARARWVAAALDRRLAGGDAAEEWSQAVALDPADPVAGPSLEGQRRAAGRFPELAALWEAREAAASDDAARSDCALRAGEAWEDAGDAERALAAHERGRALSPESLPPLQALRRLRARSGDWAGVRQALRAEGAASRDPSAAAAAYSAAAEVALQRLGDRRTAVDDLRAALARDPLDSGLAERLATALEGSGGAEELCSLRETRARTAGAPQASEEWLAAARLASEELRDHPRALAALEQALAARPAWTPALLLRSRVLAASGRPAEAVRDLAACLALGAEPAALAPIRLELAALYQGPLADPPRAMSHLNAVLAAVPEHGEALGRLADIHFQAQNWPAAADALRRLLASPALGPAERVDRLLALAEVRSEGFADAPAAAALCEQALDLSPGHPRALEELVRARERAEDPDALVAALERAGQEAGAPAARYEALQRAAQILGERLVDPGRAAALLRRALEREPGLPGLREKLADVLCATAPTEAVEEHRRILAAAPARVDSWRALFQIFRRARAHDRAFVAAGVLRFLQAADPATDGAFYAENAPLAPQGTAQVLSPADWATLRDPADRGPLSDLIALVGEPLARLVVEAPPPAPKARGGNPARRLLEELCRCLEVPSFTVLEDGEGAGLALDADPPDRVRVGADFARRFGAPEQRFLLGRIAARLKARNALAEHLGPGRLGEFLAAAVRQVDPSWAGTGEPGERLVGQVARVIPRRLRRPLEELAPLLVGTRPDLLAWYAGMSSSANRTGLLLAGDVAAALLVAMRDGAPPPPRPEGAAAVQEAVRARPDLRALLAFAASEDHFRLRQRLRLAIA